MKMNRMKALLTAAMIAILLTAAIGGTVAWIAASTDPVTNVFTPGNVNTEIEEKFENNVKSEIKISNTGSVDVYVRVAIVANWVKDGQIVAPWAGTFPFNSIDWTYREEDGYYYYNSVLKAGENSKTANLIAEGNSITYTENDVPVTGAHLEMTVIHQSIQAEGMGATSAMDAFAKANTATN